MKVSIDWLREWVDAGWDTATLAARLTMAGLEVEGIEPACAPFTGIVVGEVVACERHPDADKLTVCTVHDGSAAPLQVVCGAPNVRPGLRSAFARVGAELPGGLRIKRARLRGVESNGMLCSARELGLGEGHAGIIELPAELAVGQDLRAALALDDEVLEINVTPNRGDALSVLGVARDVAALAAAKLAPVPAEPVTAAIKERFEVRLSAPAACPRFAGRVIRGLRADARTPIWMCERLRRAGLRPISPVVDVTNYVMLELGQPMHAYDLRRLHGYIDVRWAREGEELALLDGRTAKLEPDVLVIADAAGPVGVAGIMGGERSGIDEGTTDVFLEVAYFAPDAIAGRARRLGMQTDASQRFERGVDPKLQERALDRATRLMLDIAGGQAGPAVLTQVEAELPRRPSVQLEVARIGRLLGVEVPRHEVEAMLRRLGMQVAGAGETLGVIPPSHRFDVSLPQDVIEEVARLYGYDRIPESDAPMPQVPRPATEQRVARERLALQLADRGYQQAVTYSFVAPAMQRLLDPSGESLALSNPISADLAVMRSSLWPGLVQALIENVRRQQDRVRLFEIGTRFIVTGGALTERQSIAGLAWGRAVPEQWGMPSRETDFFDVKGDVQALFALTGQRDPGYVADALPCLHPGRSARVTGASGTLGWIGELHPDLCRKLELRQPPIVFELDVESSFRAQLPVFIEISRYPQVRRDLAVVVPEAVSFDQIRSVVLAAAAGSLRELRLFDVYRGQGIEPGAKSVALGLILQERSRTLTDADGDAVVAAVIARLRSELGASIRDHA
ncbi:MAG: phenylalanine--tRNA ligase subunit beta [Steroidobacteraceae bacterium]|nr:phenylalanine--tRNA ligase subunit beta [Steroidobacteraceae bacterium]